MLSRSTIAAAVDRAFVVFKDFVRPVTFSDRSTSGFNWSTGQPTQSTTTKTVDMILLGEKLDSDLTPYYEFVAKSKDFTPTNYNTFTYGAHRYSLETQEVYEGIVLIKARRVNA
jgi:hypothetical protein